MNSIDMPAEKPLCLDDTSGSFAYKSTPDLKKAQFLFGLMRYKSLVDIGAAVLPFVLKCKLPVKGLIRNTIFKQFVGGETLTETAKVLAVLQQYQVNAILDYGVEAKQSESEFESIQQEFIRLLDFAADKACVPFISIKLTALVRFNLLEKLNNKVKDITTNPIIDIDELTATEQAEWKKFEVRLDEICQIAAQKKIGVLVDAEESWIQEVIDAVTMKMMMQYNRTQAIIFNTIQFYRTNRLQFLASCVDSAMAQGYKLGIKIVRGAYMEKERERAEKMGYPSPIQPDKTATDNDFNASLAYCFQHIETVSLIIATHNSASSLLGTACLQKYALAKNHPHVHFSQLYGMSDNITFNLARAGYAVSKYLPYGKLEDVVPYLVRRAQENTSVAGQTSAELELIETELKRRSLLHP